MMKRNVLAVVIPALLAAGAANAAEVYNKDGNKLDLTGKVVGLHYFSNDKDNDGDQSYVRLGFKGETKINDDLTGYGRFEYNFNANRTEEIEQRHNPSTQAGNTRYAYAGLKLGDFGSIDYGRNRAIGYDGISYTDVLPEWGGDQSNTDTITGRNAGVATYRNKDFFGLVQGWDFGLQYQGKHEDSTRRSKQTGDGWGVSSSYTSPVGVGVIASYESVDRTNLQLADSHGSKADVWATGLKYDANNVYVAVTYGEARNLSVIDSAATSFAPATSTADKTKIFEAVAQYTFDFGLTPSLGYVTAKAKDDSNGNNDYITKYVSLGANYAFNKNMAVYTEYDINLLDSNNKYSLANDDRVAVGIVYQF